MTDVAFKTEKNKFIANPVTEALYIDLAKGDKWVIDPNSDEPEQRFGLLNNEFQTSRDLRKLTPILKQSRTFSFASNKLKKKKVHIAKSISRLPSNTGGGRTQGNRGIRRYKIIIWPPAIFAGFNIIDVFLHEYGHIFEDFSGPKPQLFLNKVQRELGLRETSETHFDEIEKHLIDDGLRNPFAKE